MNESDILVRVACALCHLVEFHDTGEPFDIAAYTSLIVAPDVQEWLRANEVLLPKRRDGQTQLEP